MKYGKERYFKELSQEPVTNKNIGNMQEVNYIFQQSVDDIILQETENRDQNLSVKNEIHEHENADSEMDKKYLCNLNKLSPG